MEKLPQIKISLSCCLCFLLFVTPQLHAEDLSFGGHIKLQPSYFWFEEESISAASGADNFFSNIIDIRPVSEYRTGDFGVDFQAEMLARASDELASQDVIQQLAAIRVDRLSDSHRVFDLSKEVLDDENIEALARIDRMSLAWSRGNTVAKLGRQTITWGNGLLFPVLDVFNPFSPTEIDKDYKTGEDMLYAQQLFHSGDDVQFLALPRRSVDGGAIKDSESSYATHYTGRVDEAELSYNLVAGRHYGNFVSGLGLSKSLLEGVARLDFLVDVESSSEQYFRGAANYDRSFMLFGFNLYAFAEYFHNSGGLDEDEYVGGNQDLIERIVRGEVFTLGKDYLSLGGRVEWTPLWNMYVTNILNLHDESGVFQIRNDYNIGDNWLFYFGLNLPYGPRGSEFGGVQLPGGSSFLTPGREAYMRFGYFF